MIKNMGHARYIVHAIVLIAFAIMGNARAEELAPNSIELFAGITHDDGDNKFSVGTTYERRLRGDYGLGLIGEYTKDREFLVALPVFWHPKNPWRFLIAPGLELDSGDREFLVRTGGSYEFKLTGWSFHRS